MPSFSNGSSPALRYRLSPEIIAMLTMPTQRKIARTMPPAPAPIRVCFFIDRLSRAGTESQLLALIRELDRSQFEPSLILLDGEDHESRSLEPAQCEVIRLGVRKLASRQALRAARRLRHLWQVRRPDILQVYFLDSAYFAVPLARWVGIPHVLRVRNNLGYWLTRKHRLGNRLLRPFVDATLTNSEMGRTALIDNDGLRPDQVVVLANGVDLPPAHQLWQPFTGSGPIRIGCVANLRPVKNIDGLMRAARLILDQHPDVIFEVAGDGEERARLEQLHAELQLGDSFRLRGSLKDIPAFLNQVDIAVLPSHSEGMSNALLEAMAAGRAVVATDVGANARLIRDGQEGCIVPPGDDHALAEGIRNLLTNPILAREYAGAARQRAEDEFSRSAMRRRFEEFYRSLVSSRRQS